MAALTDEVTRLIEDLRDEDVDWLVHELRKRTEQRSVPLTASLSRANPVTDEHSTAAPSAATEGLRWPQLGPAAVGAALLLGWLAGIVAGPLVAIVGAVLGLVLGDRLDQHTAAAADAQHWAVLLAGDIGLGLLLTLIALIRQRRQATSRRSDKFGEAVTAILASFGLAALLVEGLLPGFWMIGGYALHGGALEDSLLPGASVSRLLVTLAIGFVISTYASVRAYISLLSTRRMR